MPAIFKLKYIEHLINAKHRASHYGNGKGTGHTLGLMGLPVPWGLTGRRDRAFGVRPVLSGALAERG